MANKKDNNIDQIIKELYDIDPSLKEYDATIRKIVAEFMASKPDTKFDKGFAAKLRARLVEGTKRTKDASTENETLIPSPFWDLKRAFIVFGTGVLAILIVVILLPNGTPTAAPAQHITKEGSHSFGDLAFSGGTAGDQSTGMRALNAQTNGTESGTKSAASAPTAAPMALAPNSGAQAGGSTGVVGGGVSLPAAQGLTVSNAQAGTAQAGGKALIYPGPITRYTYTYTGGDFSLTDKTGMVYSRTPGMGTGLAATELKDFGMGLIDLGTFSSAKTGSISLTQQKTNGYRIDVNFDQGSVSISPNYQEWPMLNGGAKGPLSANDALSDEKAILIAKAFLKEHGINLSAYGNPVVQKQVGGGPMPLPAAESGSGTISSGTVTAPSAPTPVAPDAPMSSDSAAGSVARMPVYAPETVVVIFPLQLDGETVYERGGAPSGLQVVVSARAEKVQSVYNLLSQDYTSSSYPLITDKTKLLDIVQQADTLPYRPEGMQTQEIEIDLGTPTRVLMHHYEYSGNTNKELFVPALMFPVVKAPRGSGYYPHAVLIPLVADFLKNQDPQPVIMY